MSEQDAAVSLEMAIRVIKAAGIAEERARWVAELDRLRPQLAAIEHQRWAHWQLWMHKQCVRRAGVGDLIIPATLVGRWERQIATPYDQLTETEQRSDLEQVDRYLPLLRAIATPAQENPS
jgi:hypothetical protein